MVNSETTSDCKKNSCYRYKWCNEDNSENTVGYGVSVKDTCDNQTNDQCWRYMDD